VEIIEHLALKPRRIPSQKWRDPIKKVWEVDQLLCPMTSQFQHEMRTEHGVADNGIGC